MKGWAIGMGMGWAHVGTSVAASFLASIVEFVEALTVVLAVGSVRGWRSALLGTGAALAVLLGLIAVLGPALTRIPLHAVQIAVGILLLLFGMRWLRKAMLRSAGLIPLHDEQAAFEKNAAAMKVSREPGGSAAQFDKLAFASTFHITMLEGTEVVFIVIAIGAGGKALLLPAIYGALAALALVVTLGVALHRPLAKVPENTLKFAVGVLLSGFGTFWVGEGLGIAWPGADWSIPGLVAAFLIVAALVAPMCRSRAAASLNRGGVAG